MLALIPSSKASLHDTELPNQDQALTEPTSTTCLLSSDVAAFPKTAQSFCISCPNNWSPVPVRCTSTLPVPHSTISHYPTALHAPTAAPWAVPTLALHTFLPVSRASPLLWTSTKKDRQLQWLFRMGVSHTSRFWEAGKTQSSQDWWQRKTNKQRAKRWGMDADKEVRRLKYQEERKTKAKGFHLAINHTELY